MGKQERLRVLHLCRVRVTPSSSSLDPCLAQVACSAASLSPALFCLSSSRLPSRRSIHRRPGLIPRLAPCFSTSARPVTPPCSSFDRKQAVSSSPGHRCFNARAPLLCFDPVLVSRAPSCLGACRILGCLPVRCLMVCSCSNRSCPAIPQQQTSCQLVRACSTISLPYSFV
jgi:hypothetical protein